MIYTDQMMREVRMETPPSRIVSLVPSLTELLFDLGLENEIAGITKFCIHPESIFKSKKRIGGTKNINHTSINDIQPDLIVANKEENLKADIEILEKYFPVWVTDVKNLQDATDMIRQLGEITNTKEKAESIIENINRNFSSIIINEPITTLYLIWKDPFMSAGRDTFINDMMERCGMKNVNIENSRYPQMTADEIKILNPKLILLSSEPYPFKENHIEEFKRLLPDSLILTVDGEYFSWYGSRLIKSPAYFNELLKYLNATTGKTYPASFK